MTGRERCNRLKRIRKALADRLGVDLHQVECTYEGECRGTCPKCKQEEDVLNAALFRRGSALAGAAVVATSLVACVPNPKVGIESLNGQDSRIEDVDVLSGVAEPDPDYRNGNLDLDGDVANVDIENDRDWTELSGEVAYFGDEEDDRDCPDPDDCKGENCEPNKAGNTSDKADAGSVTQPNKPVTG